MIMRKSSIMAAVLSGILLVATNAWAQEAKQNNAVSIRVAITGYIDGNYYKVTDEKGRVFRADLGKYGGRMQNKTPFVLHGLVVQDEQGGYIKMQRVEYRDPQFRVGTRLNDQIVCQNNEVKSQQASTYENAMIKSDNQNFYQNNVAGVNDTSSYTKVTLAELASLEAGMKVVFVGSGIATVEKSKIIKFWGGAGKGGTVNVVMNGSYVPLGQRCYIYGTKLADGSVSLERLDSIS